MFIRALSIAAAFSAVAASAFAQQDSNPPWYPSLMAFEHYDSARTHLFEQARFGGSFHGNNQVTVRTAPTVIRQGTIWFIWIRITSSFTEVVTETFKTPSERLWPR